MFAPLVAKSPMKSSAPMVTGDRAPPSGPKVLESGSAPARTDLARLPLNRGRDASIGSRPASSGAAFLVQAKLVVGAPDDPLEREADHAAERVLAAGETGGRPALTGVPRQIARARRGSADDHGGEDVSATVMDAISSGGAPLSSESRAFFEPRFDHSFADVRIHADGRAATAARAIGARAFTVGSNVAFAEHAYDPVGPSGRRLLAHELAHVVQQTGAGPSTGVVRRETGTPGKVLKAADQITIVVYASPTRPTPEPRYSANFRVDAQGAIVIDDGANVTRIAVAGLSSQAAAQAIADKLVEAQIFNGPRVGVTGPSDTAPAFANAKTAMPPDRERAYDNFIAYIKGTKDPADAVARYYEWLSAHRNSPDLMAIAPPELWSRSLKRPVAPADPQADRLSMWARFMSDRQAQNAKLPEAERARETEALRRFGDWFDKHKADPDFAKADPAKVYADISVALLRGSVEADSKKHLQDQKDAAASSPEALKAKSAKFDAFFNMAMKLWGYSSRTFPYSIPLNSQGKDILVTGDPALQRVLNALANDFLGWASRHISDANFATVSEQQVLINLLQSGYSEKIGQAQLHPLEHEVIDRNELLPGSILASFGETVAKGLLVVAIVGAVVGAEIITGGQATWLLVGMAGYSGFKSYESRREEIEKSNYDVPVPNTILASLGDIIGVSQLLEGITGERIGTNAPMGSENRSTQLGAGAGNIATLAVGSKAYRGGQRLGQAYKLAGPGEVPAGPNAQVPVKAAPHPAAPQPSAAMGPIEAAARKALPENLKPGLDAWSADIRSRGGNPENVYGKIPKEKISTQAKVWLDRYEAKVTAADKATRASSGDPLRPNLRNNQKLAGENVTLHFENEPPAKHEIDQAIGISRRTGEVVHLFGDTPVGIDYPGIDGTIGEPPRPLSLKRAVAAAHPNIAKQMAGDAQVSASKAGYTHVEVRVDVPGSTIAEIKAAWDGPPPRPTDPTPDSAFNGEVISRVIIRAADGEWTLTPPLKGPPRTGVSPAPARPDSPEKRDKK